MILSPEVLQTLPRKVRPTRIVYAPIALGLILLGFSLALIVQKHLGRTAINLTVLLDGLMVIPLVVLPLGRFRRDARLLKWGVAAAANINSQEVASGRSGAHLALTYAYTDDAGRTMSGRRILWGDIQPNGRTSDPMILDALATPTVFYDRKNPRTHLFYPSSLAEIQS